MRSEGSRSLRNSAFHPNTQSIEYFLSIFYELSLKPKGLRSEFMNVGIFVPKTTRRW